MDDIAIGCQYSSSGSGISQGAVYIALLAESEFWVYDDLVSLKGENSDGLARHKNNRVSTAIYIYLYLLREIIMLGEHSSNGNTSNAVVINNNRN